MTTTVATPNDVAASITLQSDGKIVVAGYTDDVPGDFTLVRYNTDGTLDTTFDGDGKLVTDIGSSDDFATSVVVQPDAKIVVAGVSDRGPGVDYDFALARYTATGGLDPTFGSGGKVTTDFLGSGDDLAFGLVRQSDGKIVVAGVSTGITNRFALARYTTAGALDPTFGSGGTTTTLIGTSSVATSIALQADGKIVVAGYTDVGIDFAVARYLPSGALDLTFGSGGTVVTDFGAGSDFAFALVIQPVDGKIVVAGETASGSTSDFALARYTTSGALDPTFGSGGKVTTTFPASSTMAKGLALRSDAKLVAAGLSDDGTVSRFALAVYNSSGVLDPTFGIGGRVTTEFGGDDSAEGVVVQSDGKIVLAGRASDLATSSFALARYLVDPNSCTTSAECDDGINCTADDCVLAVCTHTPVPGTCDDGNPCTDDACDPGTGCGHVNNIAPCDDGNACTQVDTCQLGICTGSNPVVCPAPDQCHDLGTCDPGTGTCSNPNKTNGTTCNDGSLCTQTDTCQSGICTGTNPVVCTALDQCHNVGTCSPGTGSCSNPSKANGSTCTDGNACTQTDTCQAGSCVGANPVVCTALDDCHDAGSCNPGTGVCSNPNVPNGTGCNNDGSLCTQTDTCQGGVCTGANPVICAPIDQCHNAGVCNAGTGTCSTPAKTNGAACSDSNACTQTDTCQSGTCTAGNPVICTALDQCHDVGTCSPGTGSCSTPNKANGSTCTDGNVCTQSDTCQSGTCTGANPAVCTPLDQCHVAGTCNPGSGACSNPTKPNGSTCTDSNACTQADTCQAGSCIAGSPVVCTALDQCHVAGNCSPGTGVCSSSPVKPDGAQCTDGNTCTMQDQCVGGVCEGTAAGCGDGVLQPGCGEQCDDGNTQNGDCCSASCHFEAAGAVCASDTDPCTLDSCDGAGTCAHVDEPDPACVVPLVAGKAALKIKGTTQLQFKWAGGPPIAPEFGHPDHGTPAYGLCVYTQSGATTTPVFESQASSGTCGTKPSCWSSSLTGWRFKSKDGLPEGAVGVQLVQGRIPGQARLQFKGKGPALTLPALPLAQSPVIAQLRTTNGKCWGAVFSTTRTNTPLQFSATSDGP